jgi:hypothetical protein
VAGRSVDAATGSGSAATEAGGGGGGGGLGIVWLVGIESVVPDGVIDAVVVTKP